MSRQPFNDLAAFEAVARLRSFTAAAAELGVPPSALSHKMRNLEERLGVRLLSRTTRSVAPTDAGEALLARVRPALKQIEEGVDDLSDWRDSPAGTVRLTTFSWIASSLLSRRLPTFLAAYPDITVEVTTDDGLTDIVAAGFDAGIRLSESLEKDMIAIRIDPPLRTLVVATPDYWDRHGRPAHPRDLQRHRCAGYRLPSSGRLMPWEFEKSGKALEVTISGPLVSNAWDLALETTRAGLAVGWHMEEDVARDIAAGRLETVLEDWCQPYPGAHLYHPSRRQMPPALRTLIDFLKV